ncbi:MAG: hypothetical protein MZU97_06420 [Bacillus subtilis]|nr:hypothetical protein [Bacillus subtilis]
MILGELPQERRRPVIDTSKILHPRVRAPADHLCPAPETEKGPGEVRNPRPSTGTGDLKSPSSCSSPPGSGWTLFPRSGERPQL